MLRPFFVALLAIAAMAMLLERDWGAAGMLLIGAFVVLRGVGPSSWIGADDDGDGGGDGGGD